MTAVYPSKQNFHFAGILLYNTTVVLAGPGPTQFTVGPINFASGGAYNTVSGFPWTANLALPGDFVTDRFGRRFQISSFLIGPGDPMTIIVDDIDLWGAYQGTFGNGAIYRGSVNAGLSTGLATISGGINTATQQGILQRCFNEIDQILGGGVKTVTVLGVGPNTILTLPTVSNTTYFIEINIAGRDAVGLTSYGGKNSATYQNNAGVVVRSPAFSIDDKLIFRDDPSWTVDTGVSGTDIVVNVVGSAGTTNWFVKWNITSVQ